MTNNPEIVVKRASSSSIAITTICDLASYDSDFAAVPFGMFYNEIQCCVSLRQYLICSYRPPKSSDEIAIGYALYGFLSPQAAAIRAKNLRQLTRPEYTSGPTLAIIQRCAPFGYQKEVSAKIVDTLGELSDKGQVITLDNIDGTRHNYIENI